jgi:hypothetical protein
MPHQAAFDRLARTLRHALESPTIEQCNSLVFEAIQQTERLAKAVATAAVKRGRKGGSKTAERGPDYFRQIAAMRKTRAGGRPRKSPSEGPNPNEAVR